MQTSACAIDKSACSMGSSACSIDKTAWRMGIGACAMHSISTCCMHMCPHDMQIGRAARGRRRPRVGFESAVRRPPRSARTETPTSRVSANAAGDSFGRQGVERMKAALVLSGIAAVTALVFACSSGNGSQWARRRRAKRSARARRRPSKSGNARPPPTARATGQATCAASSPGPSSPTRRARGTRRPRGSTRSPACRPRSAQGPSRWAPTTTRTTLACEQQSDCATGMCTAVFTEGTPIGLCL